MMKSKNGINNIALEWFLSYGNNGDFDKRTIRNVTDQWFVEFAKAIATEDEKIFIDECVKRLQNS